LRGPQSVSDRHPNRSPATRQPTVWKPLETALAGSVGGRRSPKQGQEAGSSLERHMYHRCGVLHTCHAYRSAKLAPPARGRSVHEGSHGGRRSHRNGKHRPARALSSGLIGGSFMMANGNVIAEAYRIVRLRYTLGQFVNLSLDQLVNEVRHEAELLRYGPIRTFIDHNDV